MSLVSGYYNKMINVLLVLFQIVQSECLVLDFENIYQSPSEKLTYFRSLKFRGFLGSGYDSPVLNLLDSQYSINIADESTGQVFKMIPDTLTTQSWLPSSNCWSLACFLHSRYRSKDSLRTHAFSQTYGSGKVSGFKSIGAFRVQNSILNLPFGEITNFEGASWLTARFDGVLSLQSVLHSITQESPKTLQQIQISSTKDSVFAVLGNCSENFIFMNADNNKNFRVDSRGLWVGSKRVKRDIKVVFDLQTPLILFDRTIYALISDKINVDARCENVSALPTIKIQMQGVSFALKPEDYIIRNENQCLSAITSWDFPEDWDETIVIGNRVLRKHQVCLDFSRSQLGVKPDDLDI